MRCFSDHAVRLVALVLSVGVLSACAGRNVQTLDDGSYSVDCSGGYHDWSACNEAARKLCRGRPVEIVSQISNEGSQGVGTRDWSTQGSEVSRRMIFRCG